MGLVHPMVLISYIIGCRPIADSDFWWLLCVFFYVTYANVHMEIVWSTTSWICSWVYQLSPFNELNKVWALPTPQTMLVIILVIVLDNIGRVCDLWCIVGTNSTNHFTLLTSYCFHFFFQVYVLMGKSPHHLWCNKPAWREGGGNPLLWNITILLAN